MKQRICHRERDSEPEREDLQRQDYHVLYPSYKRSAPLYAVLRYYWYGY